MSNSDGCLFYMKKKKKTYKGHHISEGIEIYRNSLLAVKILVCYSYCLVNLGHTLYILYHLTFVVIVWLYAIRNYGSCGFCLGTGWQNYFKTTDKK